MTIKNKNENISCCILKAEIEGQILTFKIDPFEVENCVQTIKDTFDIENPKIYVSGYALVSPETDLSRERLLELIAFNKQFISNKEKNKEYVKENIRRI